MQAMPPETIENWVDVKFATTPDSRSPTRGPPVATAIWIDEMRLPNSSVIALCKMVLRSGPEKPVKPATSAESTRR